MDQLDKTRRLFLYGTLAMGLLIVGGLVWVVLMGPGEGGGNIDPNITFNDDMNPSMGPDGAKVTVRIFSDFQCPACKLAEPALQQAIDLYKDRVRFIWNDFPLEQIHSNAKSAAVAARCAQEQNKFWEYGQSLYDHQASWYVQADPTSIFIEFAKQIGLQEGAFSACLNRQVTLDKVNQDLLEGYGMGLDSTPTFFINRKKLSGAMDLVFWQKELDKALQ